MYYFYMDKVLLPVPPSKIQTEISNQNKTINLMNEGEVNILKAPGLTAFKLEILLPLYTKYPFAMYKNGDFKSANYFLSHFEKLKVEKTQFQFIISRWKYDPGEKVKKNVLKTNVTVTLENYSITEDSSNAPDLIVALELKQYIKYGTITKKIDVISNTVIDTTKSNALSKGVPNTYTVKKGDTLWTIAKKLLGDGAKCWNLAKLNNISNPNKIKIGQVLKIQDVKATNAPASSSSSKANTKSNTAVNNLNTAINAMPGNKPNTISVKMATLTADTKESFQFFRNPTGFLSSSDVSRNNKQATVVNGSAITFNPRGG